MVQGVGTPVQIFLQLRLCATQYPLLALPMVKIYVAAASSEIERVERAHKALKNIGAKLLSEQWVESVKAATKAGLRDDGLELRKRRAHSLADLAGVETADVFWILVPGSGHASIGAWVELGYAIASAKSAFASGKSCGCTIFTSLVREFETDEQALSAIKKGES